jgi:DNA-binding CsgD family transcriptional regulator
VAAAVAASREGATQRELADRLGLPTHQVEQILKRCDIAGGPLVRQLRAHLPRLDEIELSNRERDVVKLVVDQGRTRPDAAERLGISLSTVAKDLRGVAVRLGISNR